MEPTLHMKQGRNLLDRVLQFYPYMKDGEKSVVTLTEQDWLVLMDFAENPEAAELRPSNVEDIAVDRGALVIHVRVPDCDVEVRMGM